MWNETREGWIVVQKMKKKSNQNVSWEEMDFGI